jgi:ubiquinone biosynthesis protein
VIRMLRSLWRLGGLARILARHDALFIFGTVLPGGVLRHLPRTRQPNQRPGERLAAALQDMGPTFIKLGQVLATRSDLVGDAIAADLTRLQDRLPPFPTAEAQAIIEAELERPLTELFREFSPEPVAAASIAQVHRAVTPAGLPVAVKVVRPGVAEAFRRDLELFHWLADVIERTRPRLRRLKPREVVTTLEAAIRTEMDLRMEAAAAEELRENFAHDDELYIPAIDWQRTGARVLTLEWIDGVRIDQPEALRAAGFALDDVIRTAANAFFKMVYRDGFFHADMHPGNLFVRPDGRLAVFDFGIMGRLNRDTRFYLADMLHGFLVGDYRRVAEVHFEAGYVPASQSVDLFMQACRSIGQPLLNRPLEEISIARLLGQLFAVTETFQMPTQPQLLLLQKSMMVTEGIGRTLDPQINMWELSRPLIADWAARNRGPGARFRDGVQEAGQALARIPHLVRELDSLLTASIRDGIRLHPDTVQLLARQDGTQRQRGWRLVAGVSAGIAMGAVVAALVLARG